MVSTLHTVSLFMKYPMKYVGANFHTNLWWPIVQAVEYLVRSCKNGMLFKDILTLQFYEPGMPSRIQL